MKTVLFISLFIGCNKTVTQPVIKYWDNKPIVIDGMTYYPSLTGSDTILSDKENNILILRKKNL